LSDSDGRFAFNNLRPGDYSLSQVQPIGYLPGAVTPGTLGGDASLNRIADIMLGSNEQARLNLFGHLLPPPISPPAIVPPGPLPPGIINKTDFLASTNPGVVMRQSPGFATTPQANALAQEIASATGLPAPSVYVATAQGGGGVPEIRVFDFTAGVERFRFLAYDGLFTGGVRTSIGDVTGDGQPDIVTAPGAGGGPHIKVFDGVSGLLVISFFAYDSSFTGGVYVASADVDGDGFAEIITGAGAGGSPHVIVFSGRTGEVIQSFFAYESTLRGGVTVAAGDVDDDGRAEIITGAGVGGAAHIQVIRATDRVILQSYFAFNPSSLGGVYVGAGDVDGDGRADIVAGSGLGMPPAWRVFSGSTGMMIADAELSQATAPSSVHVATADIDGDRLAEVVAARGDNNRSIVRITDPLSKQTLEEFLAFEPRIIGGVYVG